MKLLLLTLALMLAAIYVGSMALTDPGFIIIGYQGQVLRTSFIFFAIMIIIAGILLYYAVRILSGMWATPKKVSQWNTDRKDRRSQKALSAGFVALAEGNWERAEKMLASDATSSKIPHLHYLGAAEAAQGQGRTGQRDEYLQLAHDSAPQADTAVGITHAEFQIEEGLHEQARIELEDLLTKHPGHPRILKLLADIHIAAGDWIALEQLLPRIRRCKGLSFEQKDSIENQVWNGIFKQTPANVDALNSLWKKVPKKLKDDPDLLFSYLQKLSLTEETNSAIKQIRKSLGNRWDDRLIDLYSTLKGSNPVKQLETAERWLPEHENDQTLLFTLGKLCLTNELWGKAKHYLETAISFGAGAEAYQLLAETLEKMGETEEASNYRKKGLEVATSKDKQMVVVKN